MSKFIEPEKKTVPEALEGFSLPQKSKFIEPEKKTVPEALEGFSLPQKSKFIEPEKTTVPEALEGFSLPQKSNETCRGDCSSPASDIPSDKSTITIYVRLESSEPYNPPPLEEHVSMCKHRVVSEANIIGLCNIFLASELNIDSVQKKLEKLRRDYSDKSVHQANVDYLLDLDDLRFHHMSFQEYADWLHVLTKTMYDPLPRPHYITESLKKLKEEHDHRELAILRSLIRNYIRRGRGAKEKKDTTSPRSANAPRELEESTEPETTSLRIYDFNKVWRHATATRDDPRNYFMGVYIVGVHHASKKLVDKVRICMNDPSMKPLPKELDDFPTGVRLPAETYPWQHTWFIPNFFDSFKTLQQQNLMNVAVSSLLSDVPFGKNIIEHGRFTGITHYEQTDLVHVTRFFKAIGFQYVNIIDASSRIIPVAPKDESRYAEMHTRMRSRSAKEKADYIAAQLATGLHKKTRRARKLFRKQYIHKINKNTRQRATRKQ